VSFMDTNYGPTISARARLLAEGRWETCRAEIIDLMERLNIATDAPCPLTPISRGHRHQEPIATRIRRGRR
jgi:hypothetical protein